MEADERIRVLTQERDALADQVTVMKRALERAVEIFHGHERNFHRKGNSIKELEMFQQHLNATLTIKIIAQGALKESEEIAKSIGVK